MLVEWDLVQEQVIMEVVQGSRLLLTSNNSCGGGGSSDIRISPFQVSDRVLVASGGGGMGGGNISGPGR